MKTCEHKGCNNPQFGGGRCKYHQYERRMQGGDQHKRKAPIARRTKKRDKDERQYKDQALEFFNEAVKNGTNLCVFCGKKVTFFEGLHHLKGRTGDYLLDKEWWRTVHNFCHVDCYHQSDYEHRSKQPWYQAFLLRVKEASEELWRKELKKGDKALPLLNPRLEFEEDDIF